MYQSYGKPFNFIKINIYNNNFFHYSWFAEMDHAFNTNGKAKTFKKFANVKQEVEERTSKREKVLKMEVTVNEEAKCTVTSEPEIDSDAAEFIIEPYEEQTYEIVEPTVDTAVKDVETVKGSTELFLNSLRQIFERFTDKQNMQARIKIQEVLYNVMYDI